MSGNTTANSTPLIKGEIFSDIFLPVLQAQMLPDGLHRDLTAEFPEGSTLSVPSIGEAVVRDYEEDETHQFDALTSGEVFLSITEFKSANLEVSDKLKEDGGARAAAMEASIPGAVMTALAKSYESKLLNVLSTGQTLSDPNTINGFAHRWVASSGSTNGVITLEDIAYVKLAMDKADVPEMGRIAIVDPIFEMTLNNLVGAQAFTNNPQFEGLINTGFGRSHRFVTNIYGIDFWISNRMPTITETITGGPHGTAKTVTNGKPAIFMSVATDLVTPLMGAMRRNPRIKGGRDEEKEKDYYIGTSRYGFGLQRVDTLVVILHSSTVYK